MAALPAPLKTKLAACRAGTAKELSITPTGAVQQHPVPPIRAPRARCPHTQRYGYHVHHDLHVQCIAPPDVGNASWEDVAKEVGKLLREDNDITHIAITGKSDYGECAAFRCGAVHKRCCLHVQLYRSLCWTVLRASWHNSGHRGGRGVLSGRLCEPQHQTACS